MSSHKNRKHPHGGSSKDHVSHSSSSRDAKTKAGRDKGEKGKQSTKFSFLFVAHAFSFDVAGEWPRDTWGRVVPPTSIDWYSEDNLEQSSVLRYCDGRVEVAPDCCWVRSQTFDGSKGDGMILQHVSSPDEGEQVLAPAHYETCSIFQCGPHIPVCVVMQDASKGGTDYNHVWGAENRWSALMFYHPVREGDCGRQGLSQVVTMLGARPPGMDVRGDAEMADDPGYLAEVPESGTRPPRDFDRMGYFNIFGRDSSLIPSPIPSLYKNFHATSNTPESTGIGGELTVILGLMALSGERGGENEGNLGGRGYWTDLLFSGSGDGAIPPSWQGGHWHLNVPRKRITSHQDQPRGFLVQVFLDDLKNPEGSTQAALHEFEWSKTIVKE